MKPLSIRKVYQALNIKSQKIPPEMGLSYLNLTIDTDGKWRYDGYQGRVTILPSSGAYARHRILVYCPKCGRAVPFGRIAQHSKVHRNAEPNQDKR